MEMISVGSFIYLLVYPITWYNTLVIPLSLWCKWSICLYFTCMASPFPDLYNKCLGLFFCFVFLSPDIMTRSKTLSWLFICSSQNTALKGVLFVIKYKIFPNFSCGAALKRDLLFRPFMSLACSLIFLSLFFSGLQSWPAVSNHQAYALKIINVPCRYYMALIGLISCDMQVMPIDSRWKRKQHARKDKSI